jgi:myo-inositol-1(or 4)-monophosphatase
VSAPHAEAGAWLEAACRLARGAGAILRAGWGQDHQPEFKGAIDLVTDFDRRSEEFLVGEIRRRFPAHAVLTEESGAHAGSGVRWILDPLDGTTNFAHNYPFFAVSVAAEAEGRVEAGCVYDPVRDELFAAQRGGGAALNGRPIRVSSIPELGRALLVTGFPYDVRQHPERVLPLFTAFLTEAQAIRRDGSAALNLCYLACGRFDGFWEAALAPWDMAAGALIVEEAGGTVTDYVGGPFRLEGREILASNGLIHPAMRALIAATAGRSG